MWEPDHKEGWAPKNWCFWTVVREKILESPLDFKEINPVNPKGNQPWIFSGRTVLKLKVKVRSLSRVRLFVTPWIEAYQDPPSMGFSGQEYQGGLSFSFPGNLSLPRGWNHVSCIASQFFTTELPGPNDRKKPNGRSSGPLAEQKCCSSQLE